MLATDVAIQGASDIAEGKGSLLTALVVGLIIVGTMYWKQARDSAKEKSDLNEYNRTLTDRLFTIIQDNGRIVSEFTRKLDDVIRKN